jgi:O-antigen/teichoic acid export membrane protein
MLASLDYGVWALVWQILISRTLTTLFLWYQGRWWPGIEFSIKSFKEMYGFGYKLFLAQMSDTIFRNLYVVVIARIFGGSTAGLFFFAEKIRDMLINIIISSIERAIYPALSSIQNDTVKLKSGYRQVLSITSFLMFPFILFTAVLADSLFEIIVPEKWWSAVSYLQLMLLGGLLIPTSALSINILTVYGRTDLILFLEFIKKGLMVIVLVVSYRFGVIGILVGQIIVSILAFIANSYYSNYVMGYSIKDQAGCIIPYLMVAATIAAIVWGLQNVFVWGEMAKIKIAILGFSGLFVYFFACKALQLEAYRFALDLLVRKKIRFFN